MPDAVNKNFVFTNLEHRAMCRFTAKAKVQISHHEVEGVALSGDAAALGIFGQGCQFCFKSFEPTKRLLRRAVFRPPKCLLQKVAFWRAAG